MRYLHLWMLNICLYILYNGEVLIWCNAYKTQHTGFREPEKRGAVTPKKLPCCPL